MQEEQKNFMKIKVKMKYEELDSFINEINQGKEVKEEEIAYAGGSKGFFEDQSKNVIEELDSFKMKLIKGEVKEEEMQEEL